MFMLAVKTKVTFHKIYHRPQGEFNIGAWATNPKASEFGLKAHPALTSLCIVDVQEKNSTAKLPEISVWRTYSQALMLTMHLPMCLSKASSKPFQDCTLFLWRSEQVETAGNGHIKWGLCVRAKLLQSCPTLCDPMDCSPSGSSVHGILLARMLEWVAISFSRESRDQTRIS